MEKEKETPFVVARKDFAFGLESNVPNFLSSYHQLK